MLFQDDAMQQSVNFIHIIRNFPEQKSKEDSTKLWCINKASKLYIIPNFAKFTLFLTNSDQNFGGTNVIPVIW